MKRLLFFILALVFVVPAAAQTDRLVIIAEGPRYDVSRWAKTNLTAAAATSRATINTKLADSAYWRYPWLWPAEVVTNLRPIYFDNTIEMPQMGGMRHYGNGRVSANGNGGANQAGSGICILADTHRTVFDGTTNKLVLDGPLTVTGATNATPIVVTTSTNHNLVTGASVVIAGVTGNTNANGHNRVVVTGDTTFELHSLTTGANIAGNGTFGGSPTCMTGWTTVTGRAVTALDTYNSVEIAGGTGATASYRGILDVVEGASGSGRWLLDKPFAAAAVSDGAGLYCPEILRNLGLNTVIDGLCVSFKSVPGSQTNRGLVCLHQTTNPGSYGLTPEVATGKLHISNTSFEYSEIGIHHGTTLANGFDGPDSKYAGYVDNHADHLTTEKIYFGDIQGACFYHNNTQSICHSHRATHVNGLDGYVGWFDAGGIVAFNGLYIAGGAEGTREGIFYVGKTISNGTAQFSAENVYFDAGNCHNPVLVKTNWSTGIRMGKFSFVNVTLGNSATPEEPPLPIVDVQNGAFVRLENVHMGSSGTGQFGIPVGSCLLVEAGGRKPSMHVEDCVLDVVTDPEEIVASASTDGVTVTFESCRDASGVPLADKVWVKGL